MTSSSALAAVLAATMTAGCSNQHLIVVRCEEVAPPSAEDLDAVVDDVEAWATTPLRLSGTAIDGSHLSLTLALTAMGEPDWSTERTATGCEARPRARFSAHLSSADGACTTTTAWAEGGADRRWLASCDAASLLPDALLDAVTAERHAEGVLHSPFHADLVSETATLWGTGAEAEVLWSAVEDSPVVGGPLYLSAVLATVTRE